MTTKLKPLSELVGDVEVNDVVQFYRTIDQTIENHGESLKEPVRSFIGYYYCYSENNVYLSERPDLLFPSMRLSLNKNRYGYIYSIDLESITSDIVSHYQILQRANEAVNIGESQ